MDPALIGSVLLVMGIVCLLLEIKIPGFFIAIPGTVMLLVGAMGLMVPGLLFTAVGPDAVRAVRLVLSQRGEPSSWGEVAQGLRELDAGGLTGPLGFGTDGGRSGAISAWVVEGTALRPRGK